MIVFEHLELTDGTTANTRYLHDHVSFGVTSYAPAVAQRRRSALAGNGPYEEVVDTMTLNVYGDTAQNAIDNLEWLNRILDQAGRWWDGEHDLSTATTDRIAVVRLRARLQDSTQTQPVQTVVLGRVEGPNISLAPSFDVMVGRWIFQDVEVSFLRLGVWLNNSSTSASSAAAANPTVSSVAITADDYSPRKMVFAIDEVIDSPGDVISGFLLFAPVGRLVLYNAEGLTGTDYTSVADAAARAVNGNVLRYTPASTAYRNSASAAVPASLGTNAYRVAVYATLRNNSATTTWQVRAALQGIEGGQPTSFYYTAPVLIDTSTLKPRSVYLGMVALPAPCYFFTLSIAASAVSGTLDIDSVVLQSVDNEQSYAVGFSLALVGLTLTTITLDHRILVQPDPLFSTVGDAAHDPLSYSGDIAIHQYQAVDALVFAVQDSTWRLWQSPGAVAANVTLTVTQYAAYLTPQ